MVFLSSSSVLFFLSDDTVTVACVIWVSCKYLSLLRGAEVRCLLAEVDTKTIKEFVPFALKFFRIQSIKK